MSDTKFVPVITDDLVSFAKADGQIAIDLNANKIAVDVNGERFIVVDEPKIKSYVKGKANQTDLDTTNTNVLVLKVSKQDKLIAGAGITITEDNVISADGSGYTAGENVQISDTHVISATDTKYTAGENITIENNIISATVGSVTNIENSTGKLSLKQKSDQESFRCHNVLSSFYDQVLNIEASGEYSIILNSCANAQGIHSLAMGYNTIASGSYSHAEGSGVSAESVASHAEGLLTCTTGPAAHAEGEYTKAAHQGSHTGGYQTRTGMNYQTVIGVWNDPKSNTLFEIGNGADGNRHNAFEVSTDGNVTISGKTTVGTAPVSANDVVRLSDLNTATYEVIKASTQATTSSKIQNIWVGTQAEYDALAEHPDTIAYLIKE